MGPFRRKNNVDSAEEIPLTMKWGDWLRVVAPFVVIGGIVLVVAWQFIEPAPPAKVVIATGPEGSTYNEFAEEYKDFFKRRGVNLEIRKTAGARANYELMADPNSGVDLALVQGGTALPRNQTRDLEAVCTVAFEPLFILYRKASFEGPVTRLGQLMGKRIAVGKETGGTYWLATPMLAKHGIGTPADKSSKILNVSGTASAELLRKGEVDVGFYAVSADTAYIIDTLTTPGIGIVSLKQAPAYAHQMEYLTTVKVHEGSIDLEKNLPEHDVEMVAPTTSLIARKSTHKAIIELMVYAAHKVHSRRDPLAAAGAFPTLDYTEIPVSDTARYFFATKPGFLQRNLPFWASSLISRLLILIVPLLVVLIPLFRIVPLLYRWRMRARITRWYKRLKRLDERVLKDHSPERRAKRIAEADKLEVEIAQAIKVPLGYMDQFYNLRQHLGYIRDNLTKAHGVANDNAAAPTRS